MDIRKPCQAPRRWRQNSVWVVAALLTGCSGIKQEDGAPPGSVDLSEIRDAVPRQEQRSRYGNSPSYVVNGNRYYTLSSDRDYRERGIASWYGTKFHGRRTSTQEVYDMYAMTAAHKTLPLPTYVRVTNLENGRSVVVRVNDRGPFHKNRLIDLSYVAAAKLGILSQGTGLVEVAAIETALETPTRAEESPSAASVPANGPELYLQVGAFADHSNALRLKSRLDSAGKTPVLISEGTNREGSFYRVRLGPLASVMEADQLEAWLVQLGLPDAHVVVE